MEKFFTNQTPVENASQTNTSIPTPNIIPNTPHNTTPTPDTILNTNITAPNNVPVIIQDDIATTQLKSPKKEADDEPLPHTTKRKPTRNSDIWEHFTKVPGGDPLNPRCTCNYCGSDYACHTRRIGTSSLWGHFHKCKKNPHRAAAAADKKQKVLSFHKAADGGANLLAMTFNKVRCRNALAKFVVKDEQAFRVVEGEGFKEFMNELQPKFIVSSRITVARDILLEMNTCEYNTEEGG